jgi:hypothetical protein
MKLSYSMSDDDFDMLTMYLYSKIMETYEEMLHSHLKEENINNNSPTKEYKEVFDIDTLYLYNDYAINTIVIDRCQYLLTKIKADYLNTELEVFDWEIDMKRVLLPFSDKTRFTLRVTIAQSESQ